MTQLGLALTLDPVPAPGRLPVLGEPTTYPPLPARLPCYPFWMPYDGLILAGIKLDETRPGPWPGEPGWLALYAAKRIAQLQPGVADREALMLRYTRPETAQHVVGVVFVTGSRRMVPEDFARALYYDPARWVWHLECPMRLRRPLTRAEAGLRAPPQGKVFLDSKLLLDVGLEPSAEGGAP